MNTKVYLYRYYTINKITKLPELLYAGITDNLERRDKQHSSSSIWHKNHNYKTIQEFPSKQLALTAEGRAIRYEAPKYNVYHNKMKNLTFNVNGIVQHAVNGVMAVVGIHMSKIIKTEATRHLTVRMRDWS